MPKSPVVRLAGCRVTGAPGVDIVTRLYDLTDLPRFEHMLFSVVGQTGGGPLRLHVMTQRLTASEMRELRTAIQNLRYLKDDVAVILHNWDFPAPFDLRVPLLNWGLEVAVGPRVMFLNVDEQLQGNACAILSARLRNGAALALGGMLRQCAWWWGDVILPVPDEAEPLAAPTPLFMIDRRRLAVRDRVFHTGAPDEELGLFVQRITASYEVDRTYEHVALATRQEIQDSFGALRSSLTSTGRS